jgi:hypothetical protein
MGQEAVSYSTDNILGLDAALETLKTGAKLRLEVAPEGFKDPPAIEIIRAIRAGYSFDVELLDRLTKFCIMGKTVTVKADDKVIGTPFIVNGLEDNWDTYDVFRRYPCLLQFLFSMAQDYIVKKSLPPQTSTPGVAAGLADHL